MPNPSRTPAVEPLSEEQIAEIEARERVATPGPWVVWDSCSWRRIGTREPFADGNVICPITQNDGHPDLLAKREDLEFAAHARTDIPDLCVSLRAARAEIRGIRRGFPEWAAEWDGLKRTLRESENENAALREQLAQAQRDLELARQSLLQMADAAEKRQP